MIKLLYFMDLADFIDLAHVEIKLSYQEIFGLVVLAQAG